MQRKRNKCPDPGKRMKFLTGNEKKFAEFISNLDEKDRIALISHNDGDGICSALIVSKVIGEINSFNFIAYKYNMLEPFIEMFKKLKITKIIITDVAVDEDESFKKLEDFANILIIDHHPLLKDLNSSKTTMLKTSSNFPASYVCYKLFSRIGEIPCWMGPIGTLSDNMHKYRKDNARDLFDDFEFDCERDNFYDKSILLGNALVFFRGRENEIFNILKEMKDFSDLEKLEKYSEPVEKEIQFFVRDFEKNKEEKGDLFFYFFNPRYPISSALINILSLKDKNKTYVLANNKKNVITISCRSQNGNIDCPNLLKKAIREIPNSLAGGHFKAAGATIPAEYLKKFKDNLFQ